MNLQTVTVTFMFKPGQPWTRLGHFETDISRFLNERRLQGRFINGLGMQEGNIIILVEPKEDISTPALNTGAVRVQVPEEE